MPTVKQAKPELNYYPITIESSGKTSTAEKPQANMQNMPDTETIKESGGSAKVPQNSLQSSNYIKGTAGWAIKADGFAEFDDLDVRDNAYIGDRDSTHIHLDGTNARIRSSNYVAGVAGAGFNIEPSFAEFGDIRARGVIRSAVFQKDVISSVGGNITVMDSDVLNVDMTALDASTLAIEGNTAFAVGDFLRIKDGTDDEWFEVTNIASAPTYTVTRDKAGAYGADSNPAWKKGAAVINYKQSGGGFLYLTASDSNSPRMSIFTHAGSPWSAITEQLRLGNLNGFLDYVTDLYGIVIGDSEGFLSYDPTNGLVVKGTIRNSITLNAGETINGATLPVAVYVKNSDSEVYACDADDDDKLVFFGFAITSSSDGSAIDVQVIGVVDGFSGLTVGANYYVQDDKTIGTDIGTNLVMVGVAVSSTEISIQKKIPQLFRAGSDNLMASADTARFTASTSYVKLKDIDVGFKGGDVTVKFTMREDINPGGTGFARVYINGVARGIERTSTDDTLVEYSENFTINPGNNIQVYAKHSNGSYTTEVRNFRIYYGNDFVATVVTD